MNSINGKSKKRSRDDVSAPVNPAPVDDDDDGKFKLSYSLASEPSLTRLQTPLMILWDHNSLVLLTRS